MSTPEGKFKQQFCAKLKKLGCIPIPYVQTMGSRKAFPDYICFYKSTYFLLEFKASKTAKFQPGQKETLAKFSQWTLAEAVCPENADQILCRIKKIMEKEDEKM